MSQLDLAQGGPFPVPRESAIVSMLFTSRIMQILVACNIATSLSMSRCRNDVRSRYPVTFYQGCSPSPFEFPSAPRDLEDCLAGVGFTLQAMENIHVQHLK
jgi:hypothetical protein